ncbi:hypothetical protein CC80DRAFT_594174 [Byssothecium circinans]|uniref:Mid2 domain-containing protein n=1 Tax=Byssothecium circinans TaxID=147558 RepID=A0A6A5TTP3_9PLEO|nr:hypothetical protein CC80DRAFT_594174 [Byssothecium circinans]
MRSPVPMNLPDCCRPRPFSSTQVCFQLSLARERVLASPLARFSYFLGVGLGAKGLSSTPSLLSLLLSSSFSQNPSPAQYTRFRILSPQQLTMPQHPRAILSLPTVLSLYLSFFSLSTSATCFRPNGSVETNPEYVPCSTDITSPYNSICCASNRTPDRGPDICTPNGLCQVGLKKGETAGEPAWTKPQCGNGRWEGCLNVCGDKETSYLTPCDKTAGNSSRRWCCGFQNTDCCTRDDLPVETLAMKFSDASSTSSTSSTPTPITLPSSSPAPASPTTSSVKGTQGQAEEVKKGSSMSTGAKAGLGIGITLAALALLAFGFWLGKYLKNKKQKQNNAYVAFRDSTSTAQQHGPMVYRHEMHAEKGMGEMAGWNMDPVELPATAAGSGKPEKGGFAVGEEGARALCTTRV